MAYPAYAVCVVYYKCAGVPQPRRCWEKTGSAAPLAHRHSTVSLALWYRASTRPNGLVRTQYRLQGQYFLPALQAAGVRRL